MIYLVIGMVLDALIGDPHNVYHPVIAIGKWVKWLEKKLYRKDSLLRGGLLVIGVLGAISSVYWVLHSLMLYIPFLKPIICSYFFFAGLAYKSLIDAGKDVKQPLKEDNVEQARLKMGYYVSRDTQSLSRVQLVRTTVETLSENTIDGIVAPFFFGIVGELFFGQGIWWMWLYKGINTMDSMIGYRNERYEKFGKVAARLDDVANLIPARIGAMVMLLGGAMAVLDVRRAWKTLWRDHKKSVSINAGYPESVAAGLLGIQLGGAYPYFGQIKHKPVIGEDINEIDVEMIDGCEWIIHYTVLILLLIAIMLTAIHSMGVL